MGAKRGKGQRAKGGRGATYMMLISLPLTSTFEIYYCSWTDTIGFLILFDVDRKRIMNILIKVY